MEGHIGWDGVFLVPTGRKKKVPRAGDALGKFVIHAPGRIPGALLTGAFNSLKPGTGVAAEQRQRRYRGRREA